MAEGKAIGAHHPNCAVCGPDAPGNLGLSYVIEGERVRGTMHLDDRHEGAPGFVHGGVLSAALDDTIGTLLLVLRRPAVTARLEVDFRKPAFLHRDFAVAAWTDRVEGRKLHLAGEVRDDAGDVVAEGRALFVEVDLAHFQKGGKDWPESVRARWREGRDPQPPY